MLIPLRRLFLILSAVHLVRFWILPGFDSLWMDEAGAYWMIAGGWDAFWARTTICPNSRIYGLLLYPWSHIAGTSEFALRLPSLLAALCAIALAAYLLRGALGEGAGWPWLALCLASPELSFYALELRPYAFAVLLLVISMAACLSLRERLSWPAAVAWSLSAGLLVQFQPVVSLALGAQAVWMLWPARSNPLTVRRLLAFAAIGLGALLVALPEILRLLPFITGENIAQFPGRPPLTRAALLAFPRSILGPAVLAGAVLFAARKWRWKGLDPAARRLIAFAALVILSTVGLLAAYATLTHSNYFFTRYAIAVYCGWFLLLAVVLSRCMDEKGRLWFAMVYSGSTLAASLAMQAWVPRHSDADWRGALAAVREWEGERHEPLLVQAGFVEGTRVKVLRDPKWQEFLYAPVLYYGHDGPTYVLPYWAHAAQQEYLDETIRRVTGQRFAVVVYGGGERRPEYIRRIAETNPSIRQLGRFRRLQVYGVDPH